MDSIHLQGAEAVANAGARIAEAGRDIEHGAREIVGAMSMHAQALEQHGAFLASFLDRFERALMPLVVKPGDMLRRAVELVRQSVMAGERPCWCCGMDTRTTAHRTGCEAWDLVVEYDATVQR